MTPADALSLATLVALVVLGAAMLLSTLRIIVGPTLADRVLALDLLTILAMGFVVAMALRTGFLLYLDIALALALLGFLATIALARYIFSRRLMQEERQR
ncbi:MAG TPA: cation:proton antiporter [Devosia sp.]|jgi:multicomponent Na+:H+ antiporter subunit F|uniref:cation:proton antiporter n=1 Tax=Devosia sp. TaxID=1871048 RepID=UPI002F948239